MPEHGPVIQWLDVSQGSIPGSMKINKN